MTLSRPILPPTYARVTQRNELEPHTVITMLMPFSCSSFASQRLGCLPRHSSWSNSMRLLVAFLEHLQAGRRNGPSTRNAVSGRDQVIYDLS